MKITLTRTTRLTLFSTAVITVIMFFVQIFLIESIGFISEPYIAVLVALPVTALAAFFISSLIIDRALNPIRLMIERIREIGNMNFSKPLITYGEGEDVREYADAFNQIAYRLNGYIERQKRFISDASHELATPITIINGHADMLLRWGAENPQTLENGLTTIKREALRMNDLVDSLLILARSDSGKQVYAFKETDMVELLEESIAEARLIAPDFTFEANITPDLSAVIDNVAVKRVMRILFSNAVKYSEDNKRITVTAHASHGMIHVTVRDKGIGIPAEHLPRIFERFYRADASRTLKTGSSGLGLAIAREIITAHGGEIRVQSVVGEGTEVAFFIKSSV
ncbi:MAG: HAMP domain-containing histidine kinase [Defluviitaleaceae bacterium]|nr:HAMP domain-containing histidine kinase [Defluviitaleaceae bacterium]